MKFVVGCDLEEFKKYYRTLDGLHRYLSTLELASTKYGQLGVGEEYWITEDPSHLIILRGDDSEIIGHAIWHETSTDEHKKGDPRDEEDRKVLRRLLGGKKNNIVELHEIWLKPKHRRKGYGMKFFEFFEQNIKNRGYSSIIYYTENQNAISICRKRGYKEDFLKKENWHVFSLLLVRVNHKN